MPNLHRLRVIFDTNIWISYLIGKHLSQITDAIFTNRIQILYSDELMDELVTTLRRPKLQVFITEHQINKVVQLLKHKGYRIIVKQIEPVCRDPKDDFLLALALYGQADYLVSGDKDLLDLLSHHDTLICTTVFFAKRLGWPTDEALYWCTNLMRALAHPIRIKILQVIDQKGDSDKESICLDMPYNREIVLAHLRVLLLANVVLRDGRSCYTANYPLIEKATNAVAKYNRSET